MAANAHNPGQQHYPHLHQHQPLIQHTQHHHHSHQQQQPYPHQQQQQQLPLPHISHPQPHPLRILPAPPPPPPQQQYQQQQQHHSYPSHHSQQPAHHPHHPPPPPSSHAHVPPPQLHYPPPHSSHSAHPSHLRLPAPQLQHPHAPQQHVGPLPSPHMIAGYHPHQQQQQQQVQQQQPPPPPPQQQPQQPVYASHQHPRPIQPLSYPHLPTPTSSTAPSTAISHVQHGAIEYSEPPPILPRPSTNHGSSHHGSSHGRERAQSSAGLNAAANAVLSKDDDGLPATSDFVKKLFRMLEDPSFSPIVSWNPSGDCFVVRDMTEFTKTILPRLFKHSNFASFVRQLNKYDFHKVKNPDESYGEHSWTFQHPDFRADRKDMLENIKRKVPAAKAKPRPSTPTAAPSTPPPQSSHGLNGTHMSSAASLSDPSPPTQGQTSNTLSPIASTVSAAAPPGSSTAAQISHHGALITSLQSQVTHLNNALLETQRQLRELGVAYKDCLNELVSVRHGLAGQDGVLGEVMGYVMDGKDKAAGMMNATSHGTAIRMDGMSGMGMANGMEPYAGDAGYSSLSMAPAAISQAQPVPAPMQVMPTMQAPPLSVQRPATQGTHDHSPISPTATRSLNVAPTEAQVEAALKLDVGGSNGYTLTSPVHEVPISRRASMAMPASEAQLSRSSLQMSSNEVPISRTSSMQMPPPGPPPIVVPTIPQAPDLNAVFSVSDLLSERPSSSGGPSSSSAAAAPTLIKPLPSVYPEASSQAYAESSAEPYADSPDETYAEDSAQAYAESSAQAAADQAAAEQAAADQVQAFTDAASWLVGGASPGTLEAFTALSNDPALSGSFSLFSFTEVAAPAGTLASSSGSSSLAPSTASPPDVSSASATTSAAGGAPVLRTSRVRRVVSPSWVTQPRVLLVEDDAVSRRLSSKFLQVFGCTFDTAVDGEEAVSKTRGGASYDLVLMDIVMPKLDGVGATTLIREFNKAMPIISMTSNSTPQDMLTYYTHGMNDILPKPFTKEGLLVVLEKHLHHLRQQFGSLPRSIAIFPSSSLGNALGNTTATIESEDPDDTDEAEVKATPLRSMNLTTEGYANMLTQLTGFGVTIDGKSVGIMTAQDRADSAEMIIGGIKRSLEEDEDESDSKRQRFELLE